VILLRVPGTLAYRDLAVRAVAAACKLVRGDQGTDDFDDHVISAFSEAFNNVALHAYKKPPAGDLEVEIEVKPGQITIRMLDRGSGFDPSSVPTPDLDQLPETGLGVFIIHSFMDEVDYVNGVPNILTMTKRLHPASQGGGGKP
jgi:serine/threonine-protein kinase RsbW